MTEALLSAQITMTAGERSGFQLAFDLTKRGLISRSGCCPRGSSTRRPGSSSPSAIKGTPDGAPRRADRAPGGRGQQSAGAVHPHRHRRGSDACSWTSRSGPTGTRICRPPQRVDADSAPSTPTTGSTPGSSAEKVTQPPHEQLRVDYQTGTDLQYVNELARANGYTFYLEPGPAPAGPSALLGTRAAPRHPPARPERQHGRQLHRRPADFRLRRDGPRRAAGPLAGPADRGSPRSSRSPTISPLRPPLGQRRHARPEAQDAVRHRQEGARSRPRPRLLARAAMSADAISGSGLARRQPARLRPAAARAGRRARRRA